MPTYTIVSTSYCRARKGLFRRGPVRKQARRSYEITSPSMKAAVKAYRQIVQVDSGCKLKVYASLKPPERGVRGLGSGPLKDPSHRQWNKAYEVIDPKGAARIVEHALDPHSAAMVPGRLHDLKPLTPGKADRVGAAHAFQTKAGVVQVRRIR